MTSAQRTGSSIHICLLGTGFHGKDRTNIDIQTGFQTMSLYIFVQCLCARQSFHDLSLEHFPEICLLRAEHGEIVHIIWTCRSQAKEAKLAPFASISCVVVAYVMSSGCFSAPVVRASREASSSYRAQLRLAGMSSPPVDLDGAGLSRTLPRLPEAHHELNRRVIIPNQRRILHDKNQDVPIFVDG